MGIGILYIVYGDVSEVQVEGKVAVQISVVGFVLVCVSVNECTAQLAHSTEIESVGTL
jgi:uncharacterized membrane protein